MAPLPCAAVSLFVQRVRFLRTSLLFLALASAFAAIVAALAFVPAVQTWLVERALAGRPGLHVAVDSVSAGFSQVSIVNLRLRHDTVGLILPSLEATLPVKSALWDRRVAVRSVVAKGWALDLSGRPAATENAARNSVFAWSADRAHAAPVPPSPDAALAQTVVREFRGLLRGRVFPYDLSIDGLNLEGDVILPPVAGQEPARVHVILQGGGLASGRSGDFTLDASGPATNVAKSNGTLSVRGRLAVTMNSPRTVNRLAFTGQLSATAGALPDQAEVSAHIAADGPAANENYALDLSHGGRHLLTLTAELPHDQPVLKGVWQVDLANSDMARLLPARSLPGLATTGRGSFEADPAFTRSHIVGHLHTTLDHLSNLAPALDRLGVASLTSDFDLVRTGTSLHVDRASVAFVGAHPLATARSTQPFDCDLRTGAIKVPDSKANWIEGSLQGFPLAWLSGLAEETVFSGGDATGDFGVTAAHGEFALRSKGPLLAAGVSVQHAGRPLAQNLDLSATVLAEHTPAGWQFQATPLVVTSAGRRLATIEAKLSPITEPRVRQAITGKWDADLDAWAAQPVFAGIGSVLGRATTGSFTVRWGTATEINSTFTLLGHTADRSATGSVRAYLDAFGGVEFKVPLTVTYGTKKSNLSADGQWTKAKTGRRLEAELNGIEVDLDHLRPLANAFAAFRGATLLTRSEVGPTAPSGLASPTTPAPPVVMRDQQPFWGDWLGRVKLNIYTLRAGPQELTEVAGTAILDRDSFRLEGGRAVLAPPPLAPERINRPSTTKADPPRNRLSVEGTLSFDAAAESPYRLKATAALDMVDSARLFTADQAAHDPVIEGRFALADTITGTGLNLPDLFERRREEFRLVSKRGIVRLLRSDVVPSIPEQVTPLKDGFTRVGALVGALFGIRKGLIDTGMNNLSKATQAVLDFSYQTPEIRYDDLTITAIREAGRAIRLTEIALNATHAQLTGSGEIGYVKDQPLRAQPLSLELKFGAKGRIAQLLETAGLLSTDKSEQGYTLLRQPVHFGGTLEQIDNSAWRDLLLKAATATPERAKKGG